MCLPVQLNAKIGSSLSAPTDGLAGHVDVLCSGPLRPKALQNVWILGPTIRASVADVEYLM